MKVEKFKQIWMICFLLITSCMLLTNCTQDDLYTDDVQSGLNENTIRISVSMPEQDTNSRVAFDDSSLQLLWEKADTLLLVGYDANADYIGHNLLHLVDGAGTTYGSFEGKSVEGAKRYMVYYKNANLHYEHSPQSPLMSLFSQKQNGNNSTAHLRDFLDIHSKWTSAETLYSGHLHLEAFSSVLKFDIKNMPTNSSKLQRLACKIGNSRVQTIEFDNVAPTNHFTAYMGFEPMRVSLKAGEAFGVELFFTDGSCYYAEVTSTLGNTYLRGKRYTATIDDKFTWTRRDTSHQLLFKTKNNEPYSKRMHGYIIANDQNAEGYWIAVKDAMYSYGDFDPVITELPDFDAYEEHSNLESIIIPTTVTSIGEAAFYWCTNLKSISIPSSVTEIGIAAFGGCSSLSHFSGKFATSDGRYLISEDGKTLYAFAPKGMTSATVPAGVTNITEEVFANCQELTQINLPSSLEEIGFGAMGLCTNLRQIELPNGLKKIDESVFAGCTQLEKFSGKFATKDGNFLITENNSLVGAIIKDKSTIEVPEGVQYIGMNTFMMSESLNKLVFPKTVQSIGDYIFTECPNLKEVFFLSPKITVEYDDIFEEELAMNINLYLNVNLKNEVTGTNHWHTDWKSIAFVDENGKLVH